MWKESVPNIAGKNLVAFQNEKTYLFWTKSKLVGRIRPFKRI